MQELNFKTLVGRWQRETPVFWLKIRRLSVLMVGLSTGTLGVNPALEAMGVTLHVVPNMIIIVSAHAFGIFTVLGLATKLTIKEIPNENSSPS